jgi:hypothetical protein
VRTPAEILTTADDVIENFFEDIKVGFIGRFLSGVWVLEVDRGGGGGGGQT